jgi:hypothetical protein
MKNPSSCTFNLHSAGDVLKVNGSLPTIWIEARFGDNPPVEVCFFLDPENAVRIGKELITLGERGLRVLDAMKEPKHPKYADVPRETAERTAAMDRDDDAQPAIEPDAPLAEAGHAQEAAADPYGMDHIARAEEALRVE